MQRRGLGRGLDALIPTVDQSGDAVAGVKPTDLQVERILPNPYQPRRTIPPEPLEVLVQSIRTHGVLQPVMVRPLGDNYQLVAGERRWRAARMAGLTAIPALIRPCNDEDLLQFALIENLQREDLNSMEEAEAFRQLGDQFRLTQEEIAERVGRSRVSVANTMRLLNLPEPMQKAVRDRRLSEGHGRALLGAPNEPAMIKLWRIVEKRSLSVRQTENMVRREVAGQAGSQNGTDLDPNLAALQDAIQARLQTQVRVKAKRKSGGTIEIQYYSESDLERLGDLLMGSEVSL